MVTNIIENPLISIIIPTFNRKKWIKTAIDSVLNQSYNNFELFVIDDGSDDNTKEIISGYGKKINYIYQPNQGVSAARNLGIKQAKGEYITFLDSDDLWKKDKLKIQKNLLISHPEIKINYTGEIWIRNNVRVNPKKAHQKYSGWIYKQCLALCFISASSVMIHREIFSNIGLFDEKLQICEDYDLWLRICNKYPVTCIEKPLMIKTGGRKDQLSTKYWGMDRFRIQSLENILNSKELKQDNIKPTITTLHNKCTILANGFFKRNKFEEAEKYLTIKDKYKF